MSEENTSIWSIIKVNDGNTDRLHLHFIQLWFIESFIYVLLLLIIVSFICSDFIQYFTCLKWYPSNRLPFQQRCEVCLRHFYLDFVNFFKLGNDLILYFLLCSPVNHLIFKTHCSGYVATTFLFVQWVLSIFGLIFYKTTVLYEKIYRITIKCHQDWGNTKWLMYSITLPLIIHK